MNYDFISVICIEMFCKTEVQNEKNENSTLKTSKYPKGTITQTFNKTPEKEIFSFNKTKC